MREPVDPRSRSEDTESIPGEQREQALSTADIANPARARDAETERTGVNPEGARSSGEAATAAQPGETTPLFTGDEADGFRSRWDTIQAGFVDEPRRAVEQADELIAQAIKRLAEVFAEERTNLERQWDRGDDVSTEDLRVALQRYRSFFQRLLAA